MDNERKIVKIASSGICGTNISSIIEALRNSDIVVIDNEIVNPLKIKKEIEEGFKMIIDYDDIVEKSKKKQNWEKKNFYD